MNIFKNYNLTNDFYFSVYISNEIKIINPKDKYPIYYIDPKKCKFGMIKKENNQIILNASESIKNNKNNTLYATTLDGQIQFIIRDYLIIDHGKDISSYNHVTFRKPVIYKINSLSMTTQFAVSEKVYEATYFLDYIPNLFVENYFTSHNINRKKEIKLENIMFDNIKFSLNINSFNDVSTITVKFKDRQTREFTYKLICEIRNFFELIFNKPIGIRKIILNDDFSYDSDSETVRPLDQRENYFIKQDFVLKKPNVNEIYDYNDMITKNNNIESYLKSFLMNKKIQRLVQTLLNNKRYIMPVNIQLINLSSGVEVYFNDLKYTDGTTVQNFYNKLKYLFNKDFNSNENENDMILIKQYRNFVIHNDKMTKTLSEEEIKKLIKKLTKYIYQQLFMDL